MIYEAMKAVDYDPGKAKHWPMVLMPKIDGVRGYCSGQGQFLARSGDPHANLHVYKTFSKKYLIGADGELVAESVTHPDLCRLTTSATSTQDTEPFVQFWVFDWYDENTCDNGFLDRLHYAETMVKLLRAEHPEMADRLRCVPWKLVHNQAEMDAAHEEYEAMGYEGAIARRPDGKYKQGRATVLEATYLRLKSWMHDEIRVLEVIEGKTNTNELTTDALGYAKRSTHKENMIGNGMIGTIVGELVKDVVIGKKVFKAGKIVNMAPGKMTNEEAKYYFEHQEEIIGEIVKGKHFPHGVKDTLRFFTFQTFRPLSDM